MGATLSKGAKIRGSTRSRLTEDFIQRLAEDFRLHGTDVIEKLREENPAKYAEVIARLVPQEMLVHQDEHADLADMGLPELKVFMAEQMRVLFGVEIVESPATITDGTKA
jgi:hypothetical protein